MKRRFSLFVAVGSGLALAACSSHGPSGSMPNNDPMMGDYRAAPEWRAAPNDPSACRSNSQTDVDCPLPAVEQR